jgi:hypothetical protein
MWKDFLGDAIGMVCLVAICVGIYYIAWGFVTPTLNH